MIRWKRLSAYLNRHAAQYFQNTRITCRLAFPKHLPAAQLSAETRHNVFLAFEEALANTLKHAAATQVSAELKCENGTVEITVADNGRGFSEETRNGQPETEGQLGLSGMRARLRSVAGDCQITSATNGGTVVRFTLPLPKTNGA